MSNLSRIHRGLFLWLWAVSSVLPAATASPPTTAQPPETAETPAPRALESLLPNARQPRPGLLVGGQPSEAQLNGLYEAGVRTLIDLRTPAEPGATDPALAVRLGFQFLRIPIGGAQDLTRENAAVLSRAILENERQLDADGRKPPLALTCGSGNRAAALLALSAAWIDGLPAEEALDLGLRAGLTRLEPTVRSLLGIQPQ